MLEVLESLIVQKQPSAALMYIIHCFVSLYIHLNYRIFVLCLTGLDEHAALELSFPFTNINN